MRRSFSKTLAWSLAMLSSGAACSLPYQALAGYRINGIAAPQVVSDPLASQLELQLNRYRSELEARSRKVTLNEAIEGGLLANPQLAEAYSSIQQSQWDLIAVRRQWYPTLNAGSQGSGLPGQAFRTSNSSPQNGVSATGDPIALPPQTSYSNQTDVGVGLSASWTFFNPSRTPNIKAAGESLKQQQMLFDVRARDLVLELQLAYFSLQEQRQLIQAYETILASTKREVERSEALFNIGQSSIAEVEQIRTQQFSNLSTLIETYRQFMDAASRLASAMALPPGTLVMPADELSMLGSWSEPLQSTIQQALSFREEIKASLAGSASAWWRATGLFNSYWPSFSLSAGGGYAGLNRTQGLPGDSQSFNDRNLTLNGSVGVGFTWQLFDGGIAAAQGSSSRAAARQLADRAAYQRLSVTREVEQAYASYQASTLAIGSSRAQLRAAQAAAVAIAQRYRVGVSDMTSVVQALDQALLSANAYATAVRSYNSAVALLYRYSARWPDQTQAPLQQRVNSLKQR